MSNFTREEQTNIVKKALELENVILDSQDLLEQLKTERFEDEPIPPEEMEATPDYSSLPTVNLNFKDYLKEDVSTNRNMMNVIFADHPFIRALIVCLGLGILAALFSRLWILATLIGLLVVVPVPAAVFYWYTKRKAYSQKVEELNAQLPSTPEYIAAKAEVDEEVLRVQKELDERYAKEKAEYDNVILPKYKKALADWTAEHNGKINGVSARLDNAINEQSKLYEDTKIIPMQYRGIDSLMYIYELMSTSEYTVKEAVDMYDKAIQREQEYVKAQQLGRQNALLEEQNMLAVEQNELLGEQNQIAQKARREAAIRGAVGMVQHRNTNKYLKNLVDRD